MKKPTVRPPEGLMAKLAGALKVDLQQLQRQGRLSSDAVMRMQNRCTLCSDPGVCGRQVDLAGDKLTTPPKFCPNSKVFVELSKGDRKGKSWPILQTKRGA